MEVCGRSIKNLKITAETIERDPKKGPHQIFEQVIGVEISDKELQPVILSIDPQQGKYIKSLKLHRSQKVLINNNEEVRIQLMVKPNFELIQNILMHGSLVRVVEVEWLVTKIKRILNSASRSCGN